MVSLLPKPPENFEGPPALAEAPLPPDAPILLVLEVRLEAPSDGDCGPRMFACSLLSIVSKSNGFNGSSVFVSESKDS